MYPAQYFSVSNANAEKRRGPDATGPGTAKRPLGKHQAAPDWARHGSAYPFLKFAVSIRSACANLSAILSFHE